MSLVEHVIERSELGVTNARLLFDERAVMNSNSHPAVHKFGGSSLRDVTAIEQAVEIITRYCQADDFVVLSAMGKTTDLLIELLETYKDTHDHIPDLNGIKVYQSALIKGVLSETKAHSLLDELESDLQRIEWLLSHLGDDQFNSADVVGYGELWSVRLISAVLLERGVRCSSVDPRDFIYTNYIADEDSVACDSDLIDWYKSQQRFEQYREEFKATLAIVSGYIASNRQGKTVTLGRNGSDYSATIVAKLADVRVVNLWTDVHGVYSGDPNIITDAKPIDALGINEARALAGLGTSVFHEKTLKPLKDKCISIHIRNPHATLKDETGQGTLILTDDLDCSGVKIVSYQQSVCLFKIKWHRNMMSVAVIDKLKVLLQRQLISVFCWSNTDDQLSFCVKQQNRELVTKCLTRQEVGDGCEFSVHKQLSIISIVGSSLLQHAEHLSTYYALIEQSKKPVLLSHYDERGAISVVLHDSEPLNLVKDIHHRIFAKKPMKRPIDDKQLNVVVFGCGNIGAKLLEILHKRLRVINEKANQKIVVVAVCNSRHFVFNKNGVDLSRVMDDLSQGFGLVNSSADNQGFVCKLEEQLESVRNGKICIVDVTASHTICDEYIRHFSLGRDIISAREPIG